jgi:hypothetical protein
MNTLPFRHWCRLAWAVTLIAGVFVFSAGTAQAGCGDHVTIRPADGSPPAPPKPPCDGLGCDNGPANAPVSPAGLAVELRWKPPPIPWAGSAGPADESCSPVAPTPDGRPVRRSLSIFHPPRSV